METDLTSNYSTACEAHKGKSGFKAFLIFQMRTCPAAHWNSSEMQVSAQGGQPAAPLPLPQAQGNSQVRTVLDTPQLIHA